MSNKPTHPVISKLFETGEPQWVMQEGAKSLTPESFIDFLNYDSEDNTQTMSQDKRAVTAAKIMHSNPSVLDAESLDTAINLLRVTQSKQLFNALKKHGEHLGFEKIIETSGNEDLRDMLLGSYWIEGQEEANEFPALGRLPKFTVG